MRKSRRKRTTRNVISFYIKNIFFASPCAKRKVGEENPGFRKRVKSPACGGGVEEGEPARSAKNFFFGRIGRGFHDKQLQWDSLNVRIYRLTPGFENKQKSRSHRNFTHAVNRRRKIDSAMFAPFLGRCAILCSSCATAALEQITTCVQVTRMADDSRNAF